MTHQEGIARILNSILNLDIEIIEIYKRGNPFDKLLRSFSEFNSKGEPLYKNWKRAFNHYQFSVDAYNCFNDTSNHSNLYAEHIIPLSIIRDELLNLTNPTFEKILQLLNDKNRIVVITKSEQKLIDKKFKSSLPENGIDRLTFHGIEIHRDTLSNSIYIK